MNTEERIAKNLMHDVYYPFSAYVCMNEEGEVLSLRLFDTAFCSLPENDEQACSSVCLISNHPDGNMQLGKEDILNAAELKARHGKQFKMYVYAEDVGMKEIEI